MDLDWISELPEPILDHILFFMPTKDAVRTIVLSKRWYSLPRHNFRFNEEVFVKTVSSAKREDFMNWVGENLCQKVIIEMFSLTMTLSNDDDSYASHVDQWIELATRNHNIKVLALDFTIKGESKRIKKYSLPDATNVAESLTSLILRNCELRRPLFCYFLKDLSLTSVTVCNYLIDQDLISNFPLLQSFSIVDCLGFNNLQVFNHPRLKEATTKGVRKVHIEAVPNLEKLEYEYKGFEQSFLEVIDCNNLKELCLLECDMTARAIQRLISKFPFLETLKLQLSLSFKRLKISSIQLKHLCLLSTLHKTRIPRIELKRFTLFSTSYQTLEKLEIDCPNLCSYKYKGLIIPYSHFSINTSCLHYVTITLMPPEIDNTQWFLQLRKHLANFKQIDCLEIWLFTNPPDQEAFSMVKFRDESNVPPPAKLKELKVRYVEPTPDYTALVDGLLWSSYPETVSILSNHQREKEFAKHLYKRLDRKESLHCCSGSHMKCWRHYLKAFKYESSGQKIDEQSLHHSTLSESSLALEIGNNAKFILSWEFAG